MSAPALRHEQSPPIIRSVELITSSQGEIEAHLEQRLLPSVCPEAESAQDSSPLLPRDHLPSTQTHASAENDYRTRFDTPVTPSEFIGGVSKDVLIEAVALPSRVSLLSTKKSAEPTQPAPVSRMSYVSSETWTWELCAVVVSAAATISICGVLVAYSDEPVPQLPFDITLNAIVSILGTISKAALAFSMAATISQSKWLWYQDRTRRLHDLQLFDDASRGPLGSLHLLISQRANVFAKLAAFVLVILVATDPFFQQLISYPVRTVPSSRLTASVNETLAKTDSKGTVASLPALDETFLDAIRVGIYDSSLLARIPPTCPSGECTWPSYNALAFCSSCNDITTSVKATGQSYRSYFEESALQALIPFGNQTYLASLMGPLEQYYKGAYFFPQKYPDNGSLNLILPSPRLWNADLTTELYSTVSDESETTVINYTSQFLPSSITNDLVDFPDDLDSYDPEDRIYALYADENATTTHEIASITDWNANFTLGSKYAAAPVAGMPRPLVGLSSIMIDPNVTDPSVALIEALECAISFCIHTYNVQVHGGKPNTSILATHYGTIGNAGDGGWTTHVNGSNYTVNVNDLSYISGALIDALRGSVGNDGDGYYSFFMEGEVGSPTIFKIDHFPGNFGFASSFEMSAINNHGNFSRTVESVTASLNYHLQQYATHQIPGQVLTHETYVRVRWAWLVLPLFLTMLSMVALALTMWQTSAHKAVLWKSSTLPLVYRAPAELHVSTHATAAAAAAADNIASMYADARKRQVRLAYERETGRWKLEEID